MNTKQNQIDDTDKLLFESAVVGWQAADQRQKEDGANFLKYIIAYSSAFLGFSITIMTTLFKDQALSKFWLAISWGLFMVTVLFGLLLLKISQKANEVYALQLQDQIDEIDVRANPYKTACKVFEWVLYVFVALATVVNIVFILLSL